MGLTYTHCLPACALLAESCLTLCDLMDCNLPGSSVHGILQARILQWVAISSSQEIFSTQGRNLHLLHWQVNYLPLSHLGSPSPSFSSVSSVAQLCPTLCNPMNRSMPGLPVHHQLPEFTQTHVHRVGDAIQPSHPGSSPSPPASNPSQHQSLFQ